eukprot:TRINITY_DN6232_c0_g1_i3.p1 TRINITY_DN6232_c0_g1~~TRINITY_DN6232_c0_g1_i3.p1  ORF type:complete len:314 (+),score=98.57 TRINITY_DN6232_c0_g1_i3:63-944(+)
MPGGRAPDEAALTIQCFWRQTLAKRKVNNVRRLHWSLNRNALRIQKQARVYIARKARAGAKAEAERRRRLREQQFARRSLEAFKESLIWRMALVDTTAIALQRWWRVVLAARRERALQVAADVALVEKRKSLAASRASPPEQPLRQAGLPVDGPVRPTRYDRIPPSGTLRPPIRPPPSSGVPNTNVRKEERERRELRILETELLVQHTRAGDHSFAIRKEKDRLQHSSARQIQCMYRSRAARAVVASRALARQGRYMQISPAKGEDFRARAVVNAAGALVPRTVALVPQPPPR